MQGESRECPGLGPGHVGWFILADSQITLDTQFESGCPSTDQDFDRSRPAATRPRQAKQAIQSIWARLVFARQTLDRSFLRLAVASIVEGHTRLRASLLLGVHIGHLAYRLDDCRKQQIRRERLAQIRDAA
jgi:hypothetical protein